MAIIIIENVSDIIHENAAMVEYQLLQADMFSKAMELPKKFVEEQLS
jgi:hypothetical protein